MPCDADLKTLHTKCAFVGYASNSKAYRLLDLESNMLIESREIEFIENLLSDSSSQVPTSVGESQVRHLQRLLSSPLCLGKFKELGKKK